MLGLTDVQLEVVLVAEVKAVYPWRVNAVSLSILTLMLAQITIVVNIVHEAGLIVLTYKAEHVVSNLLICWNVKCIVSVTIAVHIVLHHVRVAVATTPCFVYEVIVVATLIMKSSACYDTIRSYILRVVQLNVVWSLVSRYICECRLSS